MKIHEISIRVATTADAVIIAEFSRKTFYDSYAAYNSVENMEMFMQVQFSKESLVSEVGKPSNIFLLAFSQHELVGYVKLREGETPKELNGQEALEIARIYAATEMIGKGIGKLLMKHSIELAKQKKKEVLWLAVWPNNERAINFYTKWGFQKFGHQLFLLGNDLQNDWLMKKDIL